MNKAKWIIVAVIVLLAGFALFEINNLSNQIRNSEQEKVKLWANAISQKAELVNYSEQFFASVARDEHLKMEMYTNILRSFRYVIRKTIKRAERIPAQVILIFQRVTAASPGVRKRLKAAAITNSITMAFRPRTI